MTAEEHTEFKTGSKARDADILGENFWGKKSHIKGIGSFEKWGK